MNFQIWNSTCFPWINNRYDLYAIFSLVDIPFHKFIMLNMLYIDLGVFFLYFLLHSFFFFPVYVIFVLFPLQSTFFHIGNLSLLLSYLFVCSFIYLFTFTLSCVVFTSEYLVSHRKVWCVFSFTVSWRELNVTFVNCLKSSIFFKWNCWLCCGNMCFSWD